MKTLAHILFFLLSIPVFSQYLNPGGFPLITEPQISLKTNDHNSEGFLVTWDTIIYHFFRQDPGNLGNHTGNGGRIMMRKSYDNGDTWTTPDVIFDGPYDDRNIHGGITETGRIIVTFRQYNAFTQQHIEYNLIYSDDFGNTWIGPITIPTEGVASGTHQIFGNNHIGYYNIIYNLKYCEMRHSWDGVQWDSIVYVWDYRLNNLYKISEASFVYLGNGVMIGLFRNDSGILGENFLQVESYDYGQTWTEPMLTNIADGFFCPSPWIFYDYEHNHVWIVAIDRRGNFPPTYIHNWSNVWLYCAYPDEILNNPHEYTTFLTFLRPKPSFFRIYGYPASTKTPDGNYLILFTESEYRNKGEWAYLYQFKILYNFGPYVGIQNNTFPLLSSIKLFPNPSSNFINIIGNVSEKGNDMVELRIYNSIGQTIYYESKKVPFSKSFHFVVDIHQLPEGVYHCLININNDKISVPFFKQ